MTPDRRTKRRSRRGRRLRGLSVHGLIPNAITVSATCAALTGVRFALEQRWEFAVGAILLAAILDALDGRMARLLNATSDFGAQLDSLSDFVAFGVSPAMIMYFWALNGLGGFGWVIALFFAVCAGLRLARFNSRIDSLPSYAYNYFQGVPAPAGAGLGMLPIIFFLAFPELGQLPAPVIAAWMVGGGLLMVSELPTYSFKRIKVPRRFLLPSMALVGLAVAGLAGQPWVTLFVVLAVYMATFPISFRSYQRLREAAERLQDETDDDSGNDESGQSNGNGAVPLRPVN
ncbi:CDP-alcohol phosphatidyltransferase family protein [Hwanghaeella sp.]|uniref:CDP-alcohol phosphatidyltransferase family protein n=1 Tax=Hwanghaeella sp. TaxID=2605943 RepID=UPI003CCC4454